jgi:phage tail-like protein
VAAKRDNPYGAFNFMVKLGTAGDEGSIVGGFSDVSGLGNEVKYSEYRNGNDAENHPRKVANVNSTDDVTLKRGVIGDLSLFTWLKATREGTFDPRTVTVTLLDEARSPVCSWILQQAQPKKWVGPTLTAKGGGEVAMEELHLVAERIDFQST